VVAAWSAAGPIRLELPRPAEAMTLRDGEEAAADGRRLELDGSPRLVRLAPAAGGEELVPNPGPAEP